MNDKQKVSKLEKVAYGGGGFASNSIFTAVNTFLLVFYTDVVGIAPAVAGAILLGARFWDAVNDPIMGMIVDRTKTRWGKFRPYLLFGAIPFGFFAVLTFSSPAFLGDTGRIVYAAITYVLLGMVYTAVNTPFGALTSAMTQDPTERTNISAVRVFMGILGALLVSTLIPTLVPILGGGDTARGYALTMGIFSVLGATLLLGTFSKVKERVKDAKVTGKVGFKDFFTVIRKNDQLLLLSVVFLVLFTNNTIVASVGVFFFTHVLGDVTLFSLYNLANFLPLLIGIPIMTILAARVGKKKSMVIGLVISLVAPISILLFTGNFAVLITFRIIASIGASAGVAIVWGLVPDTVEYGQWKTGVRAEGATYSIVGLFFKLGTALGGIIPGFVLQFAGYQANALQTERSLGAIIGLYSWFPIVVTTLGIVCLLFYRLNEEYYDKILIELKERSQA
jgi:glycoside/pentoside/hexuronide:cation symporter, GPH family